MPLNPTAGGRSLDAIRHNPNLSLSEKAVLQCFAAKLNFRGDFLEERHFVLSKWKTECSLSERGLVLIIDRIVNKGYLNRRTTEMGPPDYKKTYYSLTQKLFDDYLGPAKLNSHPDTNPAKLNTERCAPFSLAHTNGPTDNHADNHANKETNNDNPAKLNTEQRSVYKVTHGSSPAKLNTERCSGRARHIKLLQNSLIKADSTMIPPSVKNEINEIPGAHTPARVNDDPAQPRSKRPVRGISSISSISGILGGALLGKENPGEHVSTEPSETPAETAEETLFREACKLRRLVFTNTKRSGKGIVYLETKPMDESIAGFMGVHGVELVRLVCLNEQQQAGGVMLVYDHAMMQILFTEGSAYRHIGTDPEDMPTSEISLTDTSFWPE